MKITHVVTTMFAVGIVCHLGMADVLGAEGEIAPPDTLLVADSPQQDVVSSEPVTPEEGEPSDQNPQSSEVASGDTGGLAEPVTPEEDEPTDQNSQGDEVASGDMEVPGHEEKPVTSSTVDVTERTGLADAIRRDLDPIGKVIGSPAGQVLLAEGDVISLRIDSSIDLTPNQTFALVRSAQRVKHPKTGRNLGRFTKVIGTVRLEEAFGRFWSGRIIHSTDFVTSGDLVVSSEASAETDSSDRSRTPDHGYIVAVPDEVVLTAAFQTVYTDLGRDDAVEPGHLLSIIREGKSGRRGGPPRKIGEARVLRVEPASSAVLITRSSEPIQIGDRLEPLSGEVPAEITP